VAGLNDLTIPGYRSRPLILRDLSCEFEIVNNSWTELREAATGFLFDEIFCLTVAISMRDS
jgi:hypothetical protein